MEIIHVKVYRPPAIQRDWTATSGGSCLRRRTPRRSDLRFLVESAGSNLFEKLDGPRLPIDPKFEVFAF